MKDKIDGEELVNCPTCDGTGIDEMTGDECEDCDGDGKIFRDELPEGDE